ncbi:META domain-containing protein [Rhodoferax sp.]|uniref:META domain-containing protein n=1 Tax=Rhodoferax sp. TaxID=50421 RepID=UPI0025E82834|nr:META domain-containing protein [Rhodoferax sp.]
MKHPDSSRRFTGSLIAVVLAFACVACAAPPDIAAPDKAPAPAGPGAASHDLVTLDALAGTTWVLRAWDVAEPAPAQPVVTLSYAAGRFSGSSGCNRYTTAVTPGNTPGELQVGLVAGTRMACPDAQSAVETRFLQRLQAARRFGFKSGQLAISTPGANGPGATLLFEASVPVKPQ